MAIHNHFAQGPGRFLPAVAGRQAVLPGMERVGGHGGVVGGHRFVLEPVPAGTEPLRIQR